MKKIISIWALMVFAIIAFPGSAFPQADTNVIAYQPTPSIDPFSMFREKNYFAETYINNINIKAVTHFVKSFNNTENVKWYMISDGFIVSFTKDSVQTKVVYDREGTWHCTLAAFTEHDIPSDIRDMV